MKPKAGILLTIPLWIGSIAFIGGWLIFLIWLAGKYCLAKDFPNFEIAGFFWLTTFFWLSWFGLILLLTYIIINRKQLHYKMLLSAAIILINIPAVMLIITLYSQVEKKVFVKLINKSGADISDLKLSGNYNTLDWGEIDNSDSKVFNYEPSYKQVHARLYQKPDTLVLVFKRKGNIDTLGFPTFRMGECKELVIDKELKIND